MARASKTNRKSPRTTTKKKKDRKGSLSLLLVINTGAIAFLLIVVLILTISVLRNGKRTKRIEDSYTDVYKATNERLDVITQSLMLLIRDSNITRTSMGLPVRDYSFMDTSTEEKDVEYGDYLPLLQGIDTVLDRYKEELSLQEFALIKKNEELQQLIKEHSLSVREEAGLILVLFRGKDVFFRVHYITDAMQLAVSGPVEDNLFPVTDVEAMATYLKQKIGKIETYYEQLKTKASELSLIGENSQLQAILSEKELSLTALQEDEETYQLLVTSGTRTVLPLSLNKANGNFEIADKIAQTFGVYLPLVMSVMKELDTRSQREKLIQERHDFLVSAFKDAGMQSIFEEKGVRVSMIPREDDYFLYYDIFQGDDKIGSYALEKYNLEVYLLDKDEVQLSSLKALSTTSVDEKKNSSSRMKSQP